MPQLQIARSFIGSLPSQEKEGVWGSQEKRVPTEKTVQEKMGQEEETVHKEKTLGPACECRHAKKHCSMP